MKKILLTLFAGLAFQSVVFADTELEFTRLDVPENSTGSDLFGTTVISRVTLENNLATGKISDITEEDLLTKLTSGPKIPLYTTNNCPYGWGPADNQTLALMLDGRPDPEAYYIKGEYVYRNSGEILGKLKGVLVNIYENPTMMQNVAFDDNNNILHVRITENGGVGDVTLMTTIMAESVETLGLSWTPLAAANGAISSTTYPYMGFTHATLPDDFFLQIYVDPVS